MERDRPGPVFESFVTPSVVDLASKPCSVASGQVLGSINAPAGFSLNIFQTLKIPEPL